MLGRLQVLLPDGRNVAPRGRKARALLGYVALFGEAPSSRARLGALLWDRVDEAQSRQSFRQALAEVTHALGEPGADLLLKPDAASVALDAKRCAVDAHAILADPLVLLECDFDGIGKAGDAELLADCEGLSAAFDEWLRIERSRFEARLRSAFDRLLSAPPDLPERAARRLDFAERILAFDPTNEAAARTLMKELAARGDRPRIRRAFESLRRALRVQLDAEPSAETQAVFDAIKTVLRANATSRAASADASASEGASRPPDAVTVASADSGQAVSPAPAPAVLPSFKRPAIAVLPYATLAGTNQPPERYLLEGLADSLIQNLSSWRLFPIIARTSSFQFADSPLSATEIGAQLGAQYLVRGTLRPRGADIEVATQLLDVENGYEIVSHRTQCAADALAAAEGEIAHFVVGSIEPELLRVESERVARQSGASGSAYAMCMRGLWHHYQYDGAHNAEARAWLEHAIAADSSYAKAHSALAVATIAAVQSRWVAEPAAALVRAEEAARREVRLDTRDPAAHFALGIVALWRGKAAAAVAELEEAIGLNPSFAAARAILCHALTFAGEPERGLAHGAMAMRLSPHDVRLPLWLPALAAAAFHLGRYEEALAHAQKSLTRHPENLAGARYGVAAASRLGKLAQMADVAARLRQEFPTVSSFRTFLEKYYVDRTMVDDLVEAIAQASIWQEAGGGRLPA